MKLVVRNPSIGYLYKIRFISHLTESGSKHESALRVKVQEQIKLKDSSSHWVPSLRDSFNRQHTYLRISLTERCNLRCTYCMPAEGISLTPSASLLTTDEVIRLATLFVKSGVDKIRLTGGEPSIRKDIVEIVQRLNKLKSLGLRAIGMTSNGIALHRKLPKLVSNGLTHINLSLDTLDPFKFELLTRRPGHDAVLRSLETAVSLRHSIKAIKLNVVVMRNLNENEVVQFVELTRQLPISVRFIEFMPFNGNKWDKSKMIPSDQLLDKIKTQYPSALPMVNEPNDTARSYHVPGFAGSFGFISSMSDHFCASCNRLRITADGHIKVCLFDNKEVSLRDLIRGGASDEELMQLVKSALGGKKEKHSGMEDIDVKYNRPMITIGLKVKKDRLWTPFLTPSHNRTNHTRFLSTKAGETLSHIGENGLPQMVDVTSKSVTRRSATASGLIHMNNLAFKLITGSQDGDSLQPEQEILFKKSLAKSGGNVLVVAQLAGIMAAKSTSTMIPLCHPLPISHVDVKLTPIIETSTVRCEATVQCEGRTGVEMEALTAVSVALLTVWDMVKAVSGKEMTISEIKVMRKSGGKSGDFIRE